MKKAILFVIDSLNSGGAEKSLVSLLNLIDYSKFEVDLMVFNQEGLYYPLVPKQVNQLISPNIFIEMKYSLRELIKKRMIKRISWRLNNSLSLRCKQKFSKIKHGSQIMWPNLNREILPIKKVYDVAIAYSQGVPTYFVSTKINARKKLCWVNTNYKLAGYEKSFDKPYYKEFNNIILVSEEAKKIFVNIYPEFEYKTIVIYDIISEKLINNMAKEKNENIFNDDFKGIRILTIGRLVHVKGYDMLIEAARLLKKDNINFMWYIIGEGELKDKLIDLIKLYGLEKNIKLLGTFTNIYPFINKCDIYCQTSRFEGFGMAIAEARVLNKPIVATNFDSILNQIIHKKNGLVVEMNAKSISKGILSLIDDNQLRQNIIGYLKKEKKGNREELNKFYRMIEMT